ncbi:hypothetical protein ACJIZ3_025309 [Penstemon smallii]|uniref:RRM domain-containing protein n=1 Tax=Penstemon smallii TaxID=265156 RepID=A0ABD3TWS3_9LAMI
MANSQYGGRSWSTASGLPSRPPKLTGKRSRSEFGLPCHRSILAYHKHLESSLQMLIYYDDRVSLTVGAVYDLPIGSRQGDLARHQVNLPFDYYRQNGPSSYATTRVGGIRSEILLPPDASNTLIVEGFPAVCTHREASRILFINGALLFFLCPGEGLLALCFVEFDTPAQAATAMDCLQGYKFDRDDINSSHLRLQFSRSVARSGGGQR